MSKVLFICSGDTNNELNFVIDNNINVQIIIFHDIIYNTYNTYTKYPIIEKWKENLNKDDLIFYFTFDIYSLMSVLGKTPSIDYLFGFNINEIYSYKPNITLEEFKYQFIMQSKNKSLHALCKYLSKNKNFKTFIKYHDGIIETCFDNFKKERNKIYKETYKNIME